MAKTEDQLTSQDFQPMDDTLRDTEKISGESLSYWKDAWIRFRKNKLAILGMIILGVLIFMSIFGIWISGYDPNYQVLRHAHQPPSWDHWFGTDQLGRDIFARTWFGARISLFIGIVAAAIDVVVGMIWGAASGYFGGKVDEVMMRIVDILTGLPYLLVVILLLVVLPQGLPTLILAMCLTGWINMARIVRGQVLQLKSEEYVLAARILGAKTPRIIFKHLIPNTLSPILVTLTLTIPNAIFTEAFLSFIGIGVQPPLASWGTMTNAGIESFLYYPWELFFPAFFICVAMLAFNIIGDALRDSLDPKER